MLEIRINKTMTLSERVPSLEDSELLSKKVEFLVTDKFQRAEQNVRAFSLVIYSY